MILSTSDKISFISLIVACFSMCITLISILWTSKHNRLSVKPILKIVSCDFENHIAVHINNFGTGPLLRNNLICTNGITTSKYLIDLMPSHPHIKWDNFSKFEEYVIPANSSEPLIEIKGDENCQEFREYIKQIRFALKDIIINCEFADIYGQKFNYGPHHLRNCYNRHFEDNSESVLENYELTSA